MFNKIIGAVAVSAVALIVGSIISIEYSELIRSEPQTSSWVAQTVQHQEKEKVAVAPCAAQPLADADAVSGFSLKIPGLGSTARRITFATPHAVTYSVKLQPDSVASFYSQKLAERCWQQAEDGSLVFVKNGRVLGLNLNYNPLSEKTYVTYTRGAVAGESTVWAAQDPGAPPPGGTAPPPPPPDGGAQPPPPPGDSAGSGSYTPPPGGTGTFAPPPGDTGTYTPPPGDSGSGSYTPPPTSSYSPPPPTNYSPPLGDTSGQFPPTGPYPSGQTTYGGQYPPQGQYPDQSQFGRNQGFTPGGPGGFGRGQTGGFGPGGPGGFGPGQTGGFGPGGPGDFGNRGQGFGPGQFGEFGERQEGVEEEFQKRMDEQRFKMLKQGAEQFEQGVMRMKKEMTRVEKQLKRCNVSLPPELTNALNASDGVIASLKSAQTADELEDTLSTIEDTGMVMQEWGQQIPDLFRVCEQKKRAKRDVRQLEVAFGRLGAQVKRSKVEGVAELAGALEKEIVGLKLLADKAEKLASTDPEEAVSAYEELYDNLEIGWNTHQSVQAALNASQGLRKLDSDIKKYQATLTRLQKQKKDVDEQQRLLDELKELAEGYRNALKAKVGGEELIGIIEEVYAKRREVAEAMARLTGRGEYTPQFNISQKAIDFTLPQGFERQRPPGGFGEFGNQGFGREGLGPGGSGEEGFGGGFPGGTQGGFGGQQGGGFGGRGGFQPPGIGQ